MGEVLAWAIFGISKYKSYKKQEDFFNERHMEIYQICLSRRWLATRTTIEDFFNKVRLL